MKGCVKVYLAAFSLMNVAVMIAAPRWATGLVACLRETMYRQVITTTKKASQKSRN